MPVGSTSHFTQSRLIYKYQKEGMRAAGNSPGLNQEKIMKSMQTTIPRPRTCCKYSPGYSENNLPGICPRYGSRFVSSIGQSTIEVIKIGLSADNSNPCHVAVSKETEVDHSGVLNEITDWLDQQPSSLV